MVSVSELPANETVHRTRGSSRHISGGYAYDFFNLPGYVAEAGNCSKSKNIHQEITEENIEYNAISKTIENPIGRLIKRFLDIVLSCVSIILMLPLLIAISIFVLITMGRPVLSTQQRVGSDGKNFRCFKFRSMLSDADEKLSLHLSDDGDTASARAAQQELAQDPRITSFGRMLRKSSLDRLPQLFNILRGDMSCIAPHPDAPESQAVNIEKLPGII